MRQPEKDDTADLGRRKFFGATALAGMAFAAAGEAAGQQSHRESSETESHVVRDSGRLAGDPTTAEILVDTLIRWGVTHVFGLVGDGINPIIEALRKRQSEIAFIGVRHEEAAAFMAGGFAKHTGKLGVCLGTTGPGAIHLMNGLYDAHYDGAPVLAITGTTFHDLIGTRFMQGVDTVKLMEPVAELNVQISGPAHALIVVNQACRTALGNRCVTHVTIPKDLQAMKLSADKPSMENHGLRTSESWSPMTSSPDAQQLRAAASILNAGKRVAILAGQGALNARVEVQKIAEALGAPVAKALLGKAVLPDDSPYTTGGIGHLGTQPSQWIMQNCDTLLILGSTMPWIDSYPKQGSARAVQIDIKANHIGLRYPTELGLVGDVKTTLEALLPLVQRQSDRVFLTEAQRRMRDWMKLLDQVEKVERSPLRPQMVVRALSDLISPNAVISLDCGANTFFAARHLRLREGQRLTSPGMLATMAPGLPFSIAAQFAYPNRQSIAVVGDGGFAMLMAELTTAVQHNLPVKIVVLKNNSLSEVRFEQQELGNPPYGCDLSPIDFVAFAKACGADGFRCATPSEVRPALTAALQSSKAALVEAVVGPNEPPRKPEEVTA
ncbi:MAG TPA: thiamine pyrophosphate-dependent enzyme [Bryobacteraceae bacterium]|jgi:pyruvate dehydrogenase (quinone)/pyruvate decarboxylase